MFTYVADLNRLNILALIHFYQLNYSKWNVKGLKQQLTHLTGIQS